MRPQTQRMIDALHQRIEELVQEEKDWQQKINPEPNKLLRSIRETKLSVYTQSPRMRANWVVASAHLPSLPR